VGARLDVSVSQEDCEVDAEVQLWQVRVLVDGNLRLCGVFEDSDAAQQNDMRFRSQRQVVAIDVG